MKAQLLGQDGVTYVIPVLDRARLVKIEGNGILLTGIEIIPITKGIKNIKSNDYPQSWYCVPVHLDEQKPSDVTVAHAPAPEQACRLGGHVPAEDEQFASVPPLCPAPT